MHLVGFNKGLLCAAGKHLREMLQVLWKVWTENKDVININHGVFCWKPRSTWSWPLQRHLSVHQTEWKSLKLIYTLMGNKGCFLSRIWSSGICQNPLAQSKVEKRVALFGQWCQKLPQCEVVVDGVVLWLDSISVINSKSECVVFLFDKHHWCLPRRTEGSMRSASSNFWIWDSISFFLVKPCTEPCEWAVHHLCLWNVHVS